MTDLSHQLSANLRERYQHDVIFRALVDSMVSYALDHDLAPQDFFHAFRVVDVKVREEQIRRLSRESASE